MSKSLMVSNSSFRAAAVLLAVSAGTMPACNRRDPADLVLRNGNVYTVNAEGSLAQAVAIRDRKIVFVGAERQAVRFIGDGTKVIDLQGRMVLPGFVDSHLHPGSCAAMVFDLQLRGLDPKKEEYQAAVEAFADEHPSATVIHGHGWSEAAFAGIGPRKEWLDEVVRGRPVILESDGGHSTWVNSRALELVGLTRDTPDPPGGVIEHDPATGEPSGTLREAASALVSELDPEDFTVEQYVQGYKWIQENVMGPLGITGAFSAAGSVDDNFYAAVERLAQDGEMTFWMRGAYTADPSYDMDEWLQKADAGRRAHTTRHFQVTAIKFFEDGVIEGHTALLLEPYADTEEYSGDPGFLGLNLWEPDALNEAVAAANKLDFQTHHHAIGDRSASMALDAVAHAQHVNDERHADSRDGMTHLTLVDPPDILRFADLDMVAVPQPQWFLKDDYYFDVFVPFLGQKRADRTYPMKSFFDAGVIVASSSDWDVTVPPNPLYGIQTAVMRTFPIPPFGGRVSSEVLWPEERITLDQAIRSYTINGAYSNLLEEERGSIENGKYADLIVLDRNLFEIDPSGIHEATVLLTLYEGEEVFRHPSF